MNFKELLNERKIENKAKRFVQEIRTSVHKIRTEGTKNKDSREKCKQKRG